MKIETETGKKYLNLSERHLKMKRLKIKLNAFNSKKKMK
jgi:hypothetical protein